MITSFFGPKRASEATETQNNNSGSKRQKMTANSDEVDELLSYLQDNRDNEDTQTWSTALEKHTSSASFARLAKFIATERKSQTIFPPPADTFSALNLTPLKDVKVVIVGQDPYHGPNQGHG
jgi:uracil-DNA glycosylase